MANKFNIANYAASLERSVPADRDIEVVTHEILHLKQELARNIVDIGRRLNEAKEMLPHGAWLPWLNDQVHFSEKSAQNYMRVAREFPNPQLVADLGVRKALALLELPPSERESFVDENGVIDMTSRQLEQAIRERDEALKAAEAAQAGARSAEDARSAMAVDMAMLKNLLASAQDTESQAREDLAKAQAELKALRERPVEVAVETVADPEAIAKARAEAIAEMESKVKQAESCGRAAEVQRQAAERRLAEVSRQLEDALRSEAQGAGGVEADLAYFKLVLDQAEGLTNQLQGLLLKIRGRDEDAAGRRRRDLLDWVNRVRDALLGNS